MKCYNEKIIDFNLRRNDLFSIYDTKELQLIEVAIRGLGLPSKIMEGINKAINLIRKEKNPNLIEVIRAIS